MAAISRRSGVGRRRAFWYVAGAALVAATLVGGVGVAAVGFHDPGPEQPPPWASTASGTPDRSSRTRDVVGPGLSAEAVVATVLAQLGDPTVTAAELTPDPESSAPSAPWLDVHVSSDQGGDAKSVWLGELVQGAVSDLMRTSQSTTRQVLDGAQVIDQDRSGNEVTTPLGHGRVEGGQVFDSPDDGALRDRVDQVASRFGLTVRSVHVLHPLDSALDVAFTVPDGTVSWTYFQLSQALVQSPATIEGLYVELYAPDGTALLRVGGALRIPGGGGWTAPGQDDRFGINHG